MLTLWKQMCVLCLFLPTVSLAQTDEKPSLPIASLPNLVFPSTPSHGNLGKFGITSYVVSPDGTKVAYLIYSAGTPGSPSAMHIRNADGSDDKGVRTNADFVQPYPEDFSKDNQVLLVGSILWSDTSIQQGFGIWRVQLSTGACKRLTPPSLNSANARFSPDGKSIVFQAYIQNQKPDAASEAKTARPSNETASKTPQDAFSLQAWVYIMSSEGTNLKRLGIGVAPQWSPDGKLISYLKRMPGGEQYQLYLMDHLGKHMRAMHWSGGGLNKAYFAQFSVISVTWQDRRSLAVTGSSRAGGLPAGQLQTWVVSSDGTVKAKRPENGLRDSK